MPATVDIFNSVPLLIFPYNEGRYHRVFFTVNLLTLQQSFYDSFHRQIDRFLQCINISLCIKQSLIEYHQLRKGREHFLHDSKWCRGYVTDSSMILGNSKQIANDCRLHAMILPVLLQEGLFLQVFGNTEREKKLFSIEMKQTVVLSHILSVVS